MPRTHLLRGVREGLELCAHDVEEWLLARAFELVAHGSLRGAVAVVKQAGEARQRLRDDFPIAVTENLHERVHGLALHKRFLGGELESICGEGSNR